MSSMAIVPLPPAAVVLPAMQAEEAKAAWEQYNGLCQEILDAGDYTYYLHGVKPDGYELKPKGYPTRARADEAMLVARAQGLTHLEIRPRKKRSAWDKLAKFYGLTMPDMQGALCTLDVQQVGEFIVEKRISESFAIVIYQRADALVPIKASVTLRLRAPNGRTMVGDGSCSVSERRDGANSFAHPDHDIIGTAFTRAWNRAVSRAIGTGEVSAEEMGEEAAEAEEPIVPGKIERDAAAPKSNKVMFWQARPDDASLMWLWGYTAEAEEFLKTKCGAIRSGDKFILSQAMRADIEAWCVKNGHRIEDGIAFPQTTKPTAKPQPPQAKQITNVSTKKGKNGPYMTVVWGGQTYGCFLPKLFPFLGAGQGQDAELLTEQKGAYLNIVGLKRVGKQEFDEDGVTPVVQRGQVNEEAYQPASDDVPF